MYAGVSNGMIILAGGSNFPVSAREGGTKAYSTQIYVRPIAASGNISWTTTNATLPYGLSEGASLTTSYGVVGVGGQSAAGPVDDVFLLSWNADLGTVTRHLLPKLPQSCANVALSEFDGYLYVAGGDDGRVGLPYFRRLPLAASLAAPKNTPWEMLPTWPGPPRFGAVMMVVRVNGTDRLLLCGGRTRVAAPISATDYLSDVHLFDPSKGQWQTVTPMPHPTLLAAALRPDASHLAILGGSDGHDIERMRELGENYRLPDRIMIYDAAADTWQVNGTMPLGVAGATVVELDAGWLVVGGEYSPGLRTRHVYQVMTEGRQ